MTHPGPSRLPAVPALAWTLPDAFAFPFFFCLSPRRRSRTGAEAARYRFYREIKTRHYRDRGAGRATVRPRGGSVSH